MRTHIFIFLDHSKLVLEYLLFTFKTTTYRCRQQRPIRNVFYTNSYESIILSLLKKYSLSDV